MPGPTPVAFDVAAAPDAWSGLGFAVAEDGVVRVGAVEIRLGAAGEGVAGWTLAGPGSGAGEVDGIPTRWADAPPAPADVEHPNTARLVDHVVVHSGDVDRTIAALEAAGMTLRRERVAGDVRQAFFRHGECIVEVAGRAGDGAPGRSSLWGLTLEVADLDAAAALLGDRLAAVHDAVQPGRRIAAVRREAGAGIPLALIG